MKHHLALFAVALAAVAYTGCSTNSLAEQSPEQSRAALNNPLAETAVGDTRKETATRGLSNFIQAGVDWSTGQPRLTNYTNIATANSDFNTGGVGNFSNTQGGTAPLTVGLRADGTPIIFSIPATQTTQAGDFLASNTDGYADQLNAVNAGRVGRIDSVANLVKTSYEGQALVAGEHYDGVAQIGDKVVELSGPILEAFSPYAAAGGAIKQVVTVFDEDTGTKQTAVVDAPTN